MKLPEAPRWHGVSRLKYPGRLTFGGLFASGELMYESRIQVPLARPEFVKRLLGHVLFVLALIVVSLLIGMLGYMGFENLSWIDAFLNSAMLLGGMGPVNAPQTVAGKLFAGFYALYAGLAFIVTAGLLFAPVLHRLLHRFHWNSRG